MKKVMVYIDGFNLYYGMLKGTPYKWLDLEKFVDELVSDDVEVVAIKYFTAQIKTYPFDLQKVQRQQFYIRAVSMLPRVKVIEGFYTKHKIRMPFYKEPCISCDKTDGMASVVKLEEKRSDVNIATEMLLDALSGAASRRVEVARDYAPYLHSPISSFPHFRNPILSHSHITLIPIPTAPCARRSGFAILLARTPPGESTYVGHSIGGLFTA